MKYIILLRMVYSFVLMASIYGCSQQTQQVNNSPCATLNATVQIKPSTNLSLMLGNDAIQAAIDSITRHLALQGNTSTPSLTNLGTDAAIKTAEANGKKLTAQDKTAIEKYLREEIVPTIKQNPTCIFNVSAAAKPYVGIEHVWLQQLETFYIVKVQIKNLGQAEAYPVHVTLRNIINGKPSTPGEVDVRLGPGQWRSASLQEEKFPVNDIREKKISLATAIEVTYVQDPGSSPVKYREEWIYDTASQAFILSPNNP